MQNYKGKEPPPFETNAHISFIITVLFIHQIYMANPNFIIARNKSSTHTIQCQRFVVTIFFSPITTRRQVFFSIYLENEQHC